MAERDRGWRDFEDHWRLLQEANAFAVLAIKSAILVNGAAAIAVLTFLGHMAAADTVLIQAMVKAFSESLLSFVLGTLLALATAILAYVSQLTFFEEHRTGNPCLAQRAARWRTLAIVAGIVSAGAFGMGAWLARVALTFHFPSS